ncbi:hypothetical protein MPER_05868 [Moniliophthora perniciosa FA553]|nr:hypothetical protein MPER_05868 [Moniliophthora perniciosa FA553]
MNVFLDNYDPTIEDGEASTSGKGFVLVFRQATLIPLTCHLYLWFTSLTQEASLKEVDNLRKQIYQIKGGDRDIPIVVVGTKLDLANEREVQQGTITNLATRWGLPFYETSAKRDWQVTEVFQDLLRQMRKKYPKQATTKRPSKKSPHCVLM